MCIKHERVAKSTIPIEGEDVLASSCNNYCDGFNGSIAPTIILTGPVPVCKFWPISCKPDM